MKQNTQPGAFEEQSLTEHLRELRSCLIISFVTVFAGFCLAYSVIRPIGVWFFKPLTEVLKDTSLVFISYQEGFFFT